MYCIGQFNNIILTAFISEEDYFPLHANYDTVYSWNNNPAFVKHLSTLSDAPALSILNDTDIADIEQEIIDYWSNSDPQFHTSLESAMNELIDTNTQNEIFRYYFDFPFQTKPS